MFKDDNTFTGVSRSFQIEQDIKNVIRQEFLNHTATRQKLNATGALVAGIIPREVIIKTQKTSNFSEADVNKNNNYGEYFLNIGDPLEIAQGVRDNLKNFFGKDEVVVLPPKEQRTPQTKWIIPGPHVFNLIGTTGRRILTTPLHDSPDYSVTELDVIYYDAELKMEYIGVGPDLEPNTTVNWYVDLKGYETNGMALEINSSWRCPERNEYVGGGAGSMHMHGNAVDIQYYNHNEHPWLPIVNNAPDKGSRCWMLLQEAAREYLSSIDYDKDADWNAKCECGPTDYETCGDATEYKSHLHVMTRYK